MSNYRHDDGSIHVMHDNPKAHGMGVNHIKLAQRVSGKLTWQEKLVRILVYKIFVFLAVVSSVQAQNDYSMGAPVRTVFVSTQSPNNYDLATIATSSVVFSNNPYRHGFECDTWSGNTDKVYLNMSSYTVVASSSSKFMDPGSSWQPIGLNFTGTLSAMAGSGSQRIHCIEY